VGTGAPRCPLAPGRATVDGQAHAGHPDVAADLVLGELDTRLRGLLTYRLQKDMGSHASVDPL